MCQNILEKLENGYDPRKEILKIVRRKLWKICIIYGRSIMLKNCMSLRYGWKKAKIKRLVYVLSLNFRQFLINIFVSTNYFCILVGGYFR